MALSTLYKSSLALLTDLYQVTMAYGYWRSGMTEKESVFNLFFRKNPFAGGYVVVCGTAEIAELVSRFRVDAEDLAYLATLSGNDGRPLFEGAFLEYLSTLRFTGEIDAMPEGTVAFPHEPLVRVRGPLVQCQLLETPLLNIVNFQTLIATKAARVCQAAAGEPVLEFGLRRAQGIDGGLSASRAAYVGGCAATSNVLAGRLYGIPVRGTHAHSWVMAFDDERTAFSAYAEAMPNNCVFLVDTYDTLQGVHHAVQVGQRLRARGHELAGVRLDSGDLAYLSIEARRILDEGGFPGAAIVASNDLDEQIIASLREQGAKITVWGVGTKLVTAYDQPALGGVYKLAAIRDPGGDWQYKVKLSEQAIKVSTPGLQQVRRFFDVQKLAMADAIYDEQHPLDAQGCTIVDPLDMTRRKTIAAQTPYEDLLQPLIRGSSTVAHTDLVAARARAAAQLQSFHAGIRRFVHPHQYPVGLELGLHEFKTQLIMRARGHAQEGR